MKQNTLSYEQKLELIKTLFEREDIRKEASEAFIYKYPHASKEMVNTAIFHVYVDGMKSLLDWLVDIELFLQDSKHDLDEGLTYHVLYHLYNWLQFKTLLPDTTEDIVNKIDDIEMAIKDNEANVALDLLEELKDKYHGGLNYPDFS